MYHQQQLYSNSICICVYVNREKKKKLLLNMLPLRNELTNAYTSIVFVYVLQVGKQMRAQKERRETVLRI